MISVRKPLILDYSCLIKKLNIHNLDTAALFIYINRTAYRGYYSEDTKGNVKTSYVHHKNKVYDAERIQYMSYLYNKHNVVFSTRSYDEINYSDNAFIYFDPPYSTVFNKYDKSGFDHEKFRKFLDRVSYLPVLLSNISTFVPPHNFNIKYLEVTNKLIKKQDETRREILAENFL